MPTYKQVVNHVKKHVLWKEEYFERYYRLNPELVQKRLDKIYQAEDDLMVLISLVPYCYPAIQRGFQSGVLNEIVPFYREQKLGILAMEIMARVGFFHGEHPGVMYSHRKRLIRKMRVVV